MKRGDDIRIQDLSKIFSFNPKAPMDVNGGAKIKEKSSLDFIAIVSKILPKEETFFCIWYSKMTNNHKPFILKTFYCKLLVWDLS